MSRVGGESDFLNLTRPARKVLIYRLGSMGDTVVALPCFHLIERTFPQAQRWLLSNVPVHAKAPAAAAVLGASGLVHGYIRYTVGTRRFDELVRLAWRIRRFRPDVLIYLAAWRGEKAVKRDALFFRFCGIREIIGLPAGELAENRFDAANGLWEREATRLLRCIRCLGDADERDPRHWDLRLTNEETTRANELLASFANRPIIACGPGTKMQAKDWGREKWRSLLRRLSSSYPKHGLMLVGANEEAAIADYVSGDWSGLKINLCGCLSPRETAAVLEHASIFLGPDSGPMHLAACGGVPCVIAFSARGLPGIWYPAGEGHRILYRRVECFGCNLETCTAEARRCLTSITVDEMAAAVNSVLRLETTSRVDFESRPLL